MKTIRVKLLKGVIYKDLFWETGAVLEMDETKATYLCGTETAEPSAEKLSEFPRPLIVRSRDQAEATGEAIAKALKDAFSVPPTPKAPTAVPAYKGA